MAKVTSVTLAVEAVLLPSNLSAPTCASLDNAKIYVTHYPCPHCFRSIAASNIKEIIYLNDYNNSPIVEELASDSGIKITKII